MCMCVHTRVCVCMFVFLLFTDTQIGLKKNNTTLDTCKISCRTNWLSRRVFVKSIMTFGVTFIQVISNLILSCLNFCIEHNIKIETLRSFPATSRLTKTIIIIMITIFFGLNIP